MTESGERPARIAQWCSWFLLTLAVIRFWIMPLGSSFFCDESGSFWTIQAGPGQILARFVEFPSAPPAYAGIVWIATVLGGAREYAMRLPSVVAMALACALLYRLSARLLGRDAALPTVAAFFCSKSVIFAATDARPYAILLACIIGSVLALVRWLDSGLRRDAVVYVVTAALIPYFHYLATPVLGVQLLYGLARMREGGPVRTRSLMIAAGATVLLIAPALPLLRILIAARQAHVYLPTPNVRDLAEFLAPSVLVFGVASGLLVAWIVCRKLNFTAWALPRDSTVLLMLALALGPALLAFGISLISPTKIFVDRYMIGSLVGLSMILGGVIGQIQPAAARSIIVGAVVISSLGSFGYTRRFWPPHKDDDWRGAMAAVRQAEGISGIPVLYKCPFIECTARLINAAGPKPSWVESPISLYPATGKVIPVAYIFDESSGSYLDANVVPVITRKGRFITVNSAPDEVFDSWVNRRFWNYSVRSLGNFGGVRAVLYQDPQSR